MTTERKLSKGQWLIVIFILFPVAMILMIRERLIERLLTRWKRLIRHLKYDLGRKPNDIN